MNWASYDSSTKCIGSSRPGAQALMRWIGANYSLARNGGIYVCRPVRGSTSMSVHAEGRAIDVMLPVVNGRAHPQGDQILNRLGSQGNSLGIQSIIWNRKIYSRRSPSGRLYSGVNPHVDHLHVELNRASGENLTDSAIVRILGGSSIQRTLKLTTPTMTGSDVRQVQSAVGAAVDGFYGPGTVEKVRSWQASHGLVSDGIFGPASWAKLNG